VFSIFSSSVRAYFQVQRKNAALMTRTCAMGTTARIFNRQTMEEKQWQRHTWTWMVRYKLPQVCWKQPPGKGQPSCHAETNQDLHLSSLMGIQNTLVLPVVWKRKKGRIIILVSNGIKTSEKIFNKVVSQIVNRRTDFKSSNIYDVNNRKLMSHAPH
jgi:hypothetical protein